MKRDIVYLLDGQEVILKERLSKTKFLVEKMVICEDYDTGDKETKESGVEIVVNSIYKKIPVEALDYDIKKRENEIAKIENDIKKKEEEVESMESKIKSMINLVKSILKSSESTRDLVKEFNNTYASLLEEFRYK